MPLYEVAILEQPTKKKREEGETEKLVLDPVAVVATDDKSAAIAAVMDNPDLKVKKERMVVLVRPFAS